MVVFMNDRQVLGAFLKEKRNSRSITVRAMADMINTGYGLYGDYETGRRYPADLDTLNKIIMALRLSDDEAKILYDLAGKAREAAPPDLTCYINTTERARIALRVAKEKATDEDWEQFTKYLESKED